MQRGVAMTVIGLVGPFGSGCSYVASLIKSEYKYNVLSLSDELRELFEERNLDKNNTRSDLQDFGNNIRQEYGAEYLARRIWEKIKDNQEQGYVIDSIRNPHEIEFFRTVIPNFYLFGIFADKEVRWTRVSQKYDNDKREFEKDDHRDDGEKTDYGQRVKDSFLSADIMIQNNEKILEGNANHTSFKLKIKEKVDIINKQIPFRPTANETYMAMAYAISMRSSCLKRKVGAVIVDDIGALLSSGYNEVPITQSACIKEYGKCHRDFLKKDFRENLDNCIKKEEEKKLTYNVFKDTFKILDHCKALHAEENAILNIARTGSSNVLSLSTLYTTTYPCNLCANKIAQVGIKKIVYFEPYPMEDAKDILRDQNVHQEPFEGVTYNAYFKLMEVIY